MKLDRAIDIQRELQTSVNDLLSVARVCSLSHADILERYHALFARYPKDLPGHVRCYIRGYFSALLHNLYRTDLMHAYVWEGKLYSKWEDSPEPLKAHLRAASESDMTQHGHYWKHSEKPFFVK